MTSSPRRSARALTLVGRTRLAPLSLEICAGGGGQALGLEMAGFQHAGLVELDEYACTTLKNNRPGWAVMRRDVHDMDGRHYRGIDLIAGGVPCPPFSVAGKQLGPNDERDLFPEALRLVEQARPAAVMLENVRGFASEKFITYRGDLFERLERLGYRADWRVLEASQFGVPQLRPRFVLIALKPKAFASFRWPDFFRPSPTVGQALSDLMSSGGWPGAAAWSNHAGAIAPTIVGGSRKHGGPDLGPTRARRQWASLGVDGLGVADLPPGRDFPVGSSPKLTVRMVARLQGFPDTWLFAGGKTAAYRQVGNAFPPPVAAAVGTAIHRALRGRTSEEGSHLMELTA
jgi:DNA (cytosine-5)-methyltransferase 1